MLLNKSKSASVQGATKAQVAGSGHVGCGPNEKTRMPLGHPGAKDKESM